MGQFSVGVNTNALPFGKPDAWEVLVVILIANFFHEGLHLLAFPGAGLTRQSVLGFWPQGGSPFAQHLQPMSRNRFVLAAMLPFLVLTLLPIVIHVFGAPVSAVVQWTSLANAFGAGADLFLVAKLIFMVPAKASVLESQHSMYWKTGGAVLS